MFPSDKIRPTTLNFEAESATMRELQFSAPRVPEPDKGLHEYTREPWEHPHSLLAENASQAAWEEDNHAPGMEWDDLIYNHQTAGRLHRTAMASHISMGHPINDIHARYHKRELSKHAARLKDLLKMKKESNGFDPQIERRNEFRR